MPSEGGFDFDDKGLLPRTSGDSCWPSLRRHDMNTAGVGSPLTQREFTGDCIRQALPYLIMRAATRWVSLVMWAVRSLDLRCSSRDLVAAVLRLPWSACTWEHPHGGFLARLNPHVPTSQHALKGGLRHFPDACACSRLLVSLAICSLADCFQPEPVRTPPRLVSPWISTSNPKRRYDDSA